jgi:hypothetical protein
VAMGDAMGSEKELNVFLFYFPDNNTKHTIRSITV